MNYHEIKVDAANAGSITSDIKLKQFDYGNDVFRLMLYKSGEIYDPTSEFELCTVRSIRSDGRVNEVEIWKKDDVDLCGVAAGDDGVYYADVKYGLFESFRAGSVSFEVIFYSLSDEKRRLTLPRVSIEVYASISSYNVIDKKSIDLISHILNDISGLKTVAEAQEYIDMLEAARTAEENRASAEAERVKAEEYRIMQESVRADSESLREEAELDRETAEYERQKIFEEISAGEAMREHNEYERDLAENLRYDEEEQRILNENERVQEEEKRAAAEAEREAAEEARAQAEALRASGYEEMTEKASSAAESANNAASRVENAVESAETAVENSEKAAADAAASLEATEAATGAASESAERADTSAGNADEKAQAAALAAQNANTAAIKANEAASDASAAASGANTAAKNAESATKQASENATLAESAAKSATDAGVYAAENAEEAETAAKLALAAIETSNTAASNAAYEAERAKSAADSAEEKASAAESAAESANTAAASANSGAERVEQAVSDAEAATSAANGAASAANSAAAAATEKASAVNDAAQSANEAAESANAAADEANDAAERAEEALGLLPVVPIELSASGESIAVTDSAEARLRGLKLYGKSVQKTTEGVNLFREDLLAESTVSNGITCDYEGDGIFHIYGEYTNELESGISLQWAITPMNIPIEADSYYTFYTTILSGSHSGDDSKLAPYLGVGSESTSVKNWLTTEFNTAKCVAGTVLTSKKLGGSALSDATHVSQFWIYRGLRSGATLTIDIRIQVWFVKGDSGDVPYEPYTGAMQSPNPDYPQEIVSCGDDGGIDVVTCGKNLLDQAWFYAGTNSGITLTYIEDEDCFLLNGTSTQTGGRFYVTKLLYGKQNSSYCASVTYISGKVVVPAGYALLYFSETDETFNTGTNWINCPLENANSYVTGILNKSKICNCRFYLSSGVSFDNYKFKVQLELGSTATEWKPYKGVSLTASTPNGLPGLPVSSGGNYTDEDGQMWLCDEVDFENGVYVQRVNNHVYSGGNEFVGSGWKEGNYHCFYPQIFRNEYLAKISCYGGGSAPCFCDKFIHKAVYKIPVEGFNIHSTDSFTCSINITRLIDYGYDDTTSSGVLEFKAWCADNPITILYCLETPIETALTDEEIAAYKALYSRYPTTYISNDENAGMEVKYVADTKTYIDNQTAAMKDELTAAIITE